MSLTDSRHERKPQASRGIPLKVGPAPKGPGRLLFVEDIQHELLRDRKSAKWIRNNFDPDHKHYLGRDPYWLEDDAHRWIASGKGAL